MAKSRWSIKNPSWDCLIAAWGNPCVSRKRETRGGLCVFMTRNESAKKEYLNISAFLINSTVFTLVPLVIIFVPPYTWWGFVIKGFLALVILGSIRNLFFHPMWSRTIGFGAGITLNMLWFSLVWFLWPHWITYFFIFLILLGFGTMKKVLSNIYSDESWNLTKDH